MFASNWRRCVAVVCFLAVSVLFGQNALVAQDSGFQKQLRAGEFALALESAAAETDEAIRDRMYRQIAAAQRFGDTGSSAFGTMALIRNDDLRLSGFESMTRYESGGFETGAGFGNGAEGLPPARNGNRGGITEADFGELMDLIQETIDPDSWEANGGVGRMQPFPAGVWIDSQGTLQRVRKDRSGRLDRLAQSGPAPTELNLQHSTGLRKISLSRLEQELQRRAAAGKPVTAELKHLAGIYQLKYVMFYPETRDVVIAGPAGPWHFDGEGRAINTETGHPVLNLDDLVVCLRNARRNNGQFGCSIDPREANLVAAKQFVSQSTLKGKAFRDELHRTLGQMDVSVDGIDPSTHAARVIVEADYRMKLIGLGVEPSVSGLKNYFDRIHLDASGNLPEMDQLVRWWFTMDYDAVETNENRTVFQLKGQGVRLLSESEFWNHLGQREHTGKSSAPAKGFADDFTARFPEICANDPVFGSLKNIFDCAIAANLIHHEGLNRKIAWKLNFLDGEGHPGLLSYQVATDRVPTQVDSILGQRVVTHREGRSTLRHTISGFGGGVEFDASRHATPNQVTVVADPELQKTGSAAAPTSQDRLTWVWE